MVPDGLIQNGGCRLFVTQLSRIHPEVREIQVDGKALSQKGIKTGPGIFRLKEWPTATAGGPFEKDIRNGIEPGNHPDLPKVEPVLFNQNYPATGGKYNSRNPNQLADHARFDLPEVFLPVFLENFLNRPALGTNNKVVAVYEPVTGDRSKTLPHRGLSTAHEADKNDVGKHPLTISQPPWHASLFPPCSERILLSIRGTGSDTPPRRSLCDE